MKALPIIILSSLLIGYNFNKKEKQSGDLNLYFDSDIKIDSVLVTNITQDREFHFLKYANPINVDLNDSINDLYAISFYAANDHRMVQLWLDGRNLTIKGKISGKLQIQVDTVIGSALYNKALHFRKAYKDLLAGDPDSLAVNNFLLAAITKEINSPFSIEMANIYVSRNISNIEELKKLFAILLTQTDLIKTHLLNPYKKIETILSVNKIDFSKFRFYNKDKILTSIELAGNKRYLMDFWFIGCVPCIQEHQAIIKKLSALGTANVEVLGISIDENHAPWRNYINEKKYPWKNYREVDENKDRMRTKMVIDVFPTYLLLDSNGVILYRSNTFSAIEKYLGI